MRGKSNKPKTTYSTPPWHISGTRVFDRRGRYVAKVNPDNPNRKRDMRLIVHSPSMLRLLRRIHDDVDKNITDVSLRLLICSKVQDLIAKIEKI